MVRVVGLGDGEMQICLQEEVTLSLLQVGGHPERASYQVHTQHYELELLLPTAPSMDRSLMGCM